MFAMSEMSGMSQWQMIWQGEVILPTPWMVTQLWMPDHYVAMLGLLELVWLLAGAQHMRALRMSHRLTLVSPPSGTCRLAGLFCCVLCFFVCFVFCLFVFLFCKCHGVFDHSSACSRSRWPTMLHRSFGYAIKKNQPSLRALSQAKPSCFALRSPISRLLSILLHVSSVPNLFLRSTRGFASDLRWPHCGHFWGPQPS